MLDLSDFRDEVRVFYQGRRGVPAGDYDVHVRITSPQHVQHLVDIKPVIVEQIGQLIKNDHVIHSGLYPLAALGPSFGGKLLVELYVLGFPGKPVTKGNDFDAKLTSHSVLSVKMCAALYELQHYDAKVPAKRPE